MRSFNYREVYKSLLTTDIVAMLTQIHEIKGKQAAFVEAQQDSLIQLVEIAKIQSTDASNKIEGIYTSDERIKKLVLNKTSPRNRSEMEIAGYRDVLNSIHESYEYIPPKPSMILQLHRDLYKYSGQTHGGAYKTSDNLITEEDDQGNTRVRFAPVSAWETPEAVDALCIAYAEALKDTSYNPLLLICMFILDFLCIHPFNDGNGRMSRLLTLLLLYRAGYDVGKYISLEKLIEGSKETYYEALQYSSENWHDGRNDYLPFVRYMLGIILSAYRVFYDRVQVVTENGLSKPDKVRKTIKDTLGTITKTEIVKKHPDISQVTIQRALNDLVKSGEIIKIGGGRYTSYTWNRERE